MSDIFISYAKEDRPRAEAIAKALNDHGWSVWWDRDIRTGETYRRVIENEIKGARSVVVLWSEHSVDSNWVHEEATLGMERNILVPALTDDVELPFGFRQIQTADLTGWEGDATAPAFLRLRSDIEALIGAPVPDPVPVVAAPAGPGRRPRWRWALAAASLAALVCAGYLIYRPPTQPRPPRPPSPQTNPKDGLPYVWIEPGEFQMGATPGDIDADTDEKPRHRVRITKGFWLGESPVTVAAYKRYAGDRPQLKMPPAPDFNPDWSKPDHPIVRVTWDEAQAFCAWAGGAGGGLPTEAQWEFAARGGKDGLKYPWGNRITPENANYRGSEWNGTSPVRHYPANAWGLYDMAGSVWEWTADWYDKDYYGTLPQDKAADDPRGPQSGTMRVLRGGSFGFVTWVLRAGYRGRYAPGYWDSYIGFRCVR
jgi:formylglycine-generating enzyme required for sulfatase activity